VEIVASFHDLANEPGSGRDAIVAIHVGQLWQVYFKYSSTTGNDDNKYVLFLQATSARLSNLDASLSITGKRCDFP
jgi:hypothetical protein